MGFTEDPRTGKPIVDQAADETPEAIQAAADFAERVGHLRVGWTSERNAYEATPGDYWDDRSDGRLYRWHATRGWQLIGGAVPYLKAVQAVNGPIPANRVTPLLSMAIPNAPAGIYWWSFAMAISSNGPCQGEVRVSTAASTIQGPIAFDSPGPAGLRLPITVSATYGHSGGDLLLEFSDYRTAGGIVHAGSVAAIHYVRPLD